MSAITSPSPSPPPPLAALPAPGRLDSLAKYLKILRISMMERLVYRADFFVANYGTITAAPSSASFLIASNASLA